MGRRRNQQRNKTPVVVKKVTRCSMLNRPVFEHEVCKQYVSKSGTSATGEKNCKNCKYSF